MGVWRSPDLRNGTWALVREARDHSWPWWSADNSTSGIYFRPHVIYCRRTQQYVLWLSSWFAPQCPGGSQSCWMVGVSRSPEGPFKYSGAVAGRFADGGDFDLLVGRDDTAYIIYTSTAQGHRSRRCQKGPCPLQPPLTKRAKIIFCAHRSRRCQKN